MNFERRFGGIARLYGAAGLQQLRRAHVLVVGVGGVGSWAVEALVRSAVGQVTLLDADHVAESNINRQLPALEDTLGRAKIAVLAERAAAINPACAIRLVDDFVDTENLSSLVPESADWVIDCIDNSRVKAALIALCSRRKQALITVGAAGGQLDPTRVRITDLCCTQQDALLARTRRLLRREHGFPGKPGRIFDIPAVWSDEPARAAQDTVQTDSSLNCAGFGACMPVTAGFGLAAAAHVLRCLAGLK